MATEDLVADKSLHHWELELSLSYTRPKNSTSSTQNNTCQLQPYGLRVSPCNCATVWSLRIISHSKSHSRAPLWGQGEASSTALCLNFHHYWSSSPPSISRLPTSLLASSESTFLIISTKISSQGQLLEDLIKIKAHFKLTKYF